MGALALSLAAGVHSAARAQSVPPQDAGQPDWTASTEAPRDNWRTRSILDRQKDSTAVSPPMSGIEEGLILENYYRSIGKGGAGAKLPPRDTSSSKTSGQ
jgi:hypothetical protein